MTACQLSDYIMRRHQRAAERLARTLAQQGHHSLVQPCGDHFHIVPDPLKYAREAAKPKARRTREPFRFEPWLDLESAVHRALGAASMCWSKPPDGALDSSRLEQIADRLLEHIKAQR